MSSATDLWLGKPVPRYTSYPPAPAFHGGVGAGDYAASVRRLPPDEAVSLYIHVPFCRELCLYCGCHTSVTNRPERVSDYLRHIEREAATLAALSDVPRPVSHLHFGGGTPNIMTPEDMASLFAALRRSFDFSACREIAMELDPRTVTREHVAALAACGVTRVSLGVQDFQDDVQRIVNREQPYEQVATLCGWLREAGISRINFDLMYGLPLQTPATVAETARQVCGLGPQRMALFSYAHVPQIKPHQQPLEAYGLPDKQTLLAMDDAARAVFADAGYVAIGMDHFARPEDPLAQAMREGRLHRNFQGYTDDTASTLLGLGASSISQTPDGFFQNEKETRAWQAKVAAGELATVRGILTTPEDRLRAAVIENLMCHFTVDLAALCRQHGFAEDVFAADSGTLRPYAEGGIIALEGSKITLTTPHRMAIRVIAYAFDRYAGQKVASRAA